MALIEFPKCGKEFSEKANICPYCRQDFHEEKGGYGKVSAVSPFKRNWIIITVIVAIVCFTSGFELGKLSVTSNIKQTRERTALSESVELTETVSIDDVKSLKA